VLGGIKKRYDKWLEEATASSHGYIVAISRFPHTPARSLEFTPWFRGNYACSLTTIQGEPGTAIHNRQCSQNYYKSGQAFLIFLVQQYGTEFYRHLLAAQGTGIDALDEAIRASGGTGFQEAFRRWGSMLALPDANALPAGYGYPSIRVGRFKVPALNGPDFARFLREPQTLPHTLEPYSHIPITYADQSGHYIKKVDIPPGVALTVYIH
jgi:hypothetical protein